MLNGLNLKHNLRIEPATAIHYKPAFTTMIARARALSHNITKRFEYSDNHEKSCFEIEM